MDGTIVNPSSELWMIATLRIPGERPKVFRVEPRRVPHTGIIPVIGKVQWPLWTLEWEPPPRKGLMRFSR